MSKSMDYFLEKIKKNKKKIEIFLTNGVTLRGDIPVWDNEFLVVDGFDKKNNKDISSLVNNSQIISIKEK